MQAKSQLELALKPKADRNAAAKGTALQEALETAVTLLSSRSDGVVPKKANAAEEGAGRHVAVAGNGGGVDAADAELCVALEGLVCAARVQLQEEAVEQVCCR